MEILTIWHEDFRLSVECAKFDAVWEQAEDNVGRETLLSVYSWSDGVRSVELCEEGGKTMPIEKNARAKAIFFDNTCYPIWVLFNDDVQDARFGSHLQYENERFSFRAQVLAGFLNYGNDIGRSEIRLVYKVHDRIRHFCFSFEVLSSKLDYHRHWNVIIKDVEREYRMLSLDYMRRTFHGFSPDIRGEAPEIIWWNIFECEQLKFVKACRNILDCPRRRLRGREVSKRADALAFVSASLENELAEHRKESAHVYRQKEPVRTNDTLENRFLKFAIGQIADRFEKLKRRIEQLKSVSDIMKENMDAVSADLKRLRRNPFFRTVGRFKGMSQENLTLQKATGYSQVYRTWNLLRHAYSLNDGFYRLQTKDIAVLYEIWCFIELSHMLKRQLHLQDCEVEHRNRMELNSLFTWELGRGEHSCILFWKDGTLLAELAYNPKITAEGSRKDGVMGLVIRTVSQKPDIVLRLVKNDLREGMRLTYLFDAKYRIGGRDGRVDCPPDETINQMHRYRDAIYYKESSSAMLRKEVVGAYVLFPGSGELADVREAGYFKSIGEVGIGAFPLRPDSGCGRQLLEDFIEELIQKRSQEAIAQVIPQKGTFVGVGSRVLIGVCGQDFPESITRLCCVSAHFPSTVALQNLHFFIPYIKGKGMRDVYEITGMLIIPAGEAGEGQQSSDRPDLVFELKFDRRLFADHRLAERLETDGPTFVETTFDEINRWTERQSATT